MAKKKQFVTAAAAFAVAASAVAPAITADAASTTVRLSSDYVRVGDLDATLDKEYKGSEIHWYKSSVDMNKLGVFQTAKGFVKGQGIRVEKRVRVLNYAQEIKPESEFVFEQGVPVSGIRVQPVLFADGNEYAKPVSVAGFNTDKVGEFEGTLTYANRAYGVVTKTVKYKVVASKVEFSEVKHEVKDDMLSVSADVKNLKEGEKVELVIFPGKDESKALDPIAAEIKDGKVMVSAKDIPAGTHSFILRSGDVKTAAVEFSVEKAMVNEVKALNLKQVEVKFNGDVDKASAEAEGNYTFPSASGLTVTDAVANGDTVILTVSGALQQLKSDLTIKKVMNKSGKSIEDTTKSVTFFDVEAPTVKDLKVVGPRKVEVSFSEPLEQAPTIKLDNGSVSTSVQLSSDGLKATVVFGVEPTEGMHTLEIQNGSDFAGFKVEKVTREFNYAKDTAAPVVSISDAEPDQVTLKFSKPVSIKNPANVSVFHTLNNSAAYAGSNLTAVGAINGFSDTFTVDFNTPMPEGTTTVFLNTKENAFEDEWGNDVASTTLSSTVTLDKVAPTVLSVVAEDESEFKVSFSEDVAGADSKANYVLTDKDGKVVSISAASLSYDDEKFVAEFSNLNLAPGAYTLTVKNIADTSFSENKLVSQVITFSVPDSTPWNVSEDAIVSSDNTKIRVTFDEAMSADGLTTLSNYALYTSGGAKESFPANSSIVAINNKTVEIRLGSAITDLDTYNLRIAGLLKDAAGNGYSSTQYKEIGLTTDALTENSVVENSAKTKTTTTLSFQLDQELSGSLNPEKFSLDGGLVVGGASYVNNAGKSTVTLTLKAINNNEFSANATPTLSVLAGALTNAYGTANAPFSVSIADGLAPEVLKSGNDLQISDKTDTDESDFVITFNENLGDGTALVASDLIITKANGDVLVAGDDYSVDEDGANLVVTLENEEFAGQLTVASVATPAYIRDVAGNRAKAFAATTVNITSTVATEISAAKSAIGSSYEFASGVDLTADNSATLKTALDAQVNNADITLDVTKVTDNKYSVEITHASGGTSATVSVDVTVAS
ncbi:Ig-like domain-containing protein [Exiguobacterium profundum]|uniref:Ig-like domain-containing protein n=1 Tax=Exiguobacterium profundum TaxID=307643 RepID=UPI0033987D29